MITTNKSCKISMLPRDNYTFDPFKFRHVEMDHNSVLFSFCLNDDYLRQI